MQAFKFQHVERHACLLPATAVRNFDGATWYPVMPMLSLLRRLVSVDLCIDGLSWMGVADGDVKVIVSAEANFVPISRDSQRPYWDRRSQCIRHQPRDCEFGDTNSTLSELRI